MFLLLRFVPLLCLEAGTATNVTHQHAATLKWPLAPRDMVPSGFFVPSPSHYFSYVSFYLSQDADNQPIIFRNNVWPTRGTHNDSHCLIRCKQLIALRSNPDHRFVFHVLLVAPRWCTAGERQKCMLSSRGAAVVSLKEKRSAACTVAAGMRASWNLSQTSLQEQNAEMIYSCCHWEVRLHGFHQSQELL